MFEIEEELKKLPDQPGVYLMHDKNDTIIYIGKAVSLTKRVRQYFRASYNEGLKKIQMVRQIQRFEYIITDTELEALVLENNLIKEYQPKYNTMLRDDKTYPYIKVTVDETYPRVVFSRIMKKDKSKYFGPYSNAGAVKETIELMNKLYGLRTCSRVLPKDIGKERPCLNYYIKQCMAPCQGYISESDYRDRVDKAIKFLMGDYKQILKDLEKQMYDASEQMEFEKAKDFRDLLENVRMVAQKQKMINTDGEDKDVIGLASDDQDAVVQVFFIRNGKLIGREHFYMKVASENSRSQILSAFIEQYYSGTPFIPRHIMLPDSLTEIGVVSEWLAKKRGQKVYLDIPQKGSKEKLVELAQKNAERILELDREKLKREEGRTIGAVKQIAELIGVERLLRIEAYDISNISGFQSVGSMIVYEKGRPARSDYRKFRLKTVSGPDDYASMREVLTRRFAHGLEELQELKEQEQDPNYGSFTKFPDLIMMDGGRGQVNIALTVLGELGIDIPVCGMVKDDHHRTRGLFYQNEEIPIDKNSEGFHLITRIQDEAHRFAIEYHRSLRTKGQVHSILDDIKGIGPARRKALMKKYESLDSIKKATLEELANTDGMTEQSARSVFDFFHTQNIGSVEAPLDL
ncbi:MAG: excinuclease ABC subunit UvrC [Lachnospiraceae bacterium]